MPQGPGAAQGPLPNFSGSRAPPVPRERPGPPDSGSPPPAGAGDRLRGSCPSSSAAVPGQPRPVPGRAALTMVGAGRGLLSLLLLLRLPLLAAAAAKAPVCQEITVPMCKGIGYNLTYMPNQFNHDTQDEAGLEVHQFWPLVEIQCSPDLRFFLCSVYTPICLLDYAKPLPPCRAVCERAKAGCSPLMRQYGFAWPERMSCDRLPALGDPDTLCMDYNRSEPTTPPAAPPALAKPTRASRGPQRSLTPDCGRVCRCTEPFVPIARESHPLYSKIRTGQVPNCAVPCFQPYFTQDEKTFASFWIGLWSILCFLSTSTTVATFLIDMERFRYPERPIIFLSACYLFVSLGYIVRLVAGHASVACNPEYRHVHYETTGPALCTMVFLLLYFFGMASSIWWVILSLTWFLAAGLKWGNEAIAGYSQYFHLAAWLIPSVKSIAVLALSSVDGDPVAGVCYVGNQNLDNLRGFVLAPLVVYLFTGTLFLLAGFVSLFRIRSVIKQGGTKTDKLEKLMIRIGIFTVLYTVPATLVVACYVYEQHYRESWEKAHNCSCPGDPSKPKPDYAIFMLKYFMCLVVGITSGVWIWSGKTLDSWRQFTGKWCRGRKPSTYSEAGSALTARAGGAPAASYHKPVPLSQV
ncbi:frizzled-5 [Trachemys scripta elegans]|uniref:frizzled-5 n=1 Tax=Trachemys scripta elegans TaxID=31138 RepID=UPI00155587BC|nr:frizzled-5 [Trachemys scripta elegans]